MNLISQTSCKNTLMKNQKGFSLIELMIALTLGLIITGVVVQVFSSSRTTYDLEEGLAEVQEQARFAMEFIAQDIRQAGNFGCAKLDRQAINSIVRNPDGPMSLLNDPYNPASTRPVGLITYEYTGGGGVALTDWTPPLPANGFFDILGGGGPALIPFSDVLVVQYAIALNVQLFNPGQPTNANLQLVRNPTTTGAFKQNDIVFVSDCKKGDMFRVTNVPDSGAGGSITLAHGVAGNTQALLENRYDNSADVMKMATRAYFVGVNPAVTPEPTLYRLALDTNDWTPDPLVEGVEQLKLLMGIDATTPTTTENAGTSEIYVTPIEMTTIAGPTPRDMSSVIDLKVGFVVRSSKVIDPAAAQSEQVIADKPLSIFGATNTIYRTTPAPPPGTFDPELFKRRRLFTMTVNKRNK